MESQLEILQRLRNTNDEKEMSILSDELIGSLSYNDKIISYLDNYFHSFLINNKKVVKSFDEDYFKLRIKIYTDDKNWSNKIVIGLAFLPKRRLYHEDDEKNMLALLENEIDSMGLSLVVNDISVNNLQIVKE